MIIRYKAAPRDVTKPHGYAIGCPVRVYFAGQFHDVVYQFPGGGQSEAVVHLPSGSILAMVHDRHAQGNAPQQRAQEAVDYAFGNMLPGPIRDKMRRAAVLNAGTRERVGTLRRPTDGSWPP